MKIVDTTVFIDAERRHQQAVERIAELLERGELAVSAVTVFELTCGPRTPRRLLAHYDALFGSEARVLPVSHAAALLAAEAARASAGLKAPDALIAGTALEHGARVVTSDADLRRVPGLIVEWVPRAPIVHEPEAVYASARRPEQVAERIRALRMTAGIRACDAASAAGMPRSNYARVESGRHQLSLATLERVAMAIRVPVAELLRAGSPHTIKAETAWRWSPCPS